MMWQRLRNSMLGQLVLVLAVAGALRCWYVAVLPGQNGDMIHSDMAAYDAAAWAMCEGKPVEGGIGFNGYHPLSASTYYYAGYTWFVAGVYKVFGHRPEAVRWVQAIIGTVSVGLVFLVAAMALNRRAALAAAWLTAVHLPQVYYTGLLLTETWYTFLQLTALALWLCVWEKGSGTQDERPPKVALAVAAGLFAGLTCISRPVFLPAVFALAAGAYFYAPHVPNGRRVAVIGGLLLAAGAAIAPVAVRNYQIHGRFILVSTNGPSTFYTGHVTHEISMPLHVPPRMTDAQLAAAHRRLSMQYLREHWPRYLAELPEFFASIWLSNDFWPNATTYRNHNPAQFANRRTRLVIDEPGGPAFGRLTHFPDLMRYADAVLWLLIGLPLGVLAALLLPRAPPRWLWIYLTLIPYLLTPLIAWPMARYRMPAVPLVFMLAGHTLVTLWDCRGPRR